MADSIEMGEPDFAAIEILFAEHNDLEPFELDWLAPPTDPHITDLPIPQEFSPMEPSDLISLPSELTSVDGCLLEPLVVPLFERTSILTR